MLKSITTDGERIALCDEKGNLLIWTPSEGGITARHPLGVHRARYTADGRRLVAITADDKMHVLRGATHERVIDTAHRELAALAVHPELPRVATTGADGHVRVWDLTSGECLFDFAGSAAGTSVALCNEYVAAGFASGEFVAWQLDTKRDIAGGEAFRLGTVSATAFSPDGRFLVLASSRGGMIAVASGDKWSSVAGWRVPPKDIATNALVFTPDGRRFVAAHSDDTLTLLFPSPNDPIGETFGHAFYVDRKKWTRDFIVSDACFVPGTDLMLTAHFTGKVRVWRVSDRWKLGEVSIGIFDAEFPGGPGGWWKHTGRTPPHKTCAACGKDAAVFVVQQPAVHGDVIASHLPRLEECSECKHVAVDIAVGSVDPDAHELLAVEGHHETARRCLYVALHTTDPKERGAWLLRAASFDDLGGFTENAGALRRRAWSSYSEAGSSDVETVRAAFESFGIPSTNEAGTPLIEREAVAKGKEPFALVPFEKLLNRGAQASREKEHRRAYDNSDARTLREFVEELYQLEPDLGLAAPIIYHSEPARTLEEIQFFMRLEKCVACGSSEVTDEALNGGEAGWSWYATCAGCGALRRHHRFRTKSNPRTARAGRHALGTGHSELLSADQLFAALDETLSRLPSSPPPTHAERLAARAEISRALTCVVELLKLAPLGDDPPPQPRLARKSLEKEYIAVRKLVPSFAPLPTMTSAMLKAHEEWLDRGGRGGGHIALVNQSLVSEIYIGANLTFATFTNCNLTDIDLNDAHLDEGHLEDVILDRALLAATSLTQTTITRSRFLRADLSRAKLNGAKLVDSDFSRSDLDRCAFYDVRAQRARFDGAHFGSAILDRATFENCSFVDASFKQFLGVPTTAGARFVDCDLRGTDWTERDLRGAVFVRCRFEGATAIANRAEGVVFEACDGL